MQLSLIVPETKGNEFIGIISELAPPRHRSDKVIWTSSLPPSPPPPPPFFFNPACKQGPLCRTRGRQESAGDFTVFMGASVLLGCISPCKTTNSSRPENLFDLAPPASQQIQKNPASAADRKGFPGAHTAQAMGKNKTNKKDGGGEWVVVLAKEVSGRPDASTTGSLAPLQGRGDCPVSCPLTPKQASRWQGAEELARKGDPRSHNPI